MNKPFDTKVKLPQPTVELEKGHTELAKLEDAAGIFGRMKAKRKTKNDAANAIGDIRGAQIEAVRDVQLTAITIARTSLKAALVGEAMAGFGTLATRLNAATGAVEQALTSGSAIETVSHFANRAENLTQIQQLLADGKITAEEAEVVTQSLHSDTYADINGTRERQTIAKGAVKALYICGIARIEKSKDAF